MAEPATSAVNDLAGAFWDGFLERHPTLATTLGDERWNDRLEDPGPEGRAADVAALRDTLARAAEIDPAGLPTEEAITLDMLEVMASTWLAVDEQGLWQLDAVDAIGGPQTLPGNLARIQRADTPERLEALVCRLEAYPGYLAAWRVVLEAGATSGMTAAAPVLARAREQVGRLLATPTETSPLLAGLGPQLDDDGRAAVAAAVERHVRPALARFAEALAAYAPHVRPADGLWSVPDGSAAYRTCARYATSLDVSPEELHTYGLDQLEAIDAERLAIARELGHADVAALRAELAADPANRTADPAELIRRAEEQIARASAAAPRAFGRLPRAACVVRPVEPYMEPDSPGAFYIQPAPDGSRPGIYYLNTYRAEEHPLNRLAPTTFHEAVPGHHFQISIETELDGLPPFRRLGSHLVSLSFAEGWGLYAERLADELGLYLDPRERLGMLDQQAWRACRLIVDTGIHAFRWDRARSIELLESAAALPRAEAEIETDRYIGWPGQALAYMTGQREIVSLRRLLEARDGDRFDLRAFHDAVLGHGTLTLATLRHQLPDWVAARPA